MPNDLATLETQRSKLLEEFLGLRDLRPGSITAARPCCGKPSCHCAKHNDRGHHQVILEAVEILAGCAPHKPWRRQP